MPRNDKSPDDKGKVKFRFVEFELEGHNSTIEESIKNIVHSMSRSSTISTRVLPAKTGAPAGLGSADENGGGSLDREQEPEVNSEDPGEDQASPPVRTTNPRHYTQPKFLSDLDLDSGDVPFKVYAEQQAPKSDNRKYIIIAAWLKKYRNLETVSIDHIFTCNQTMGWKSQKDVGQPFRYMKQKSYFERADGNQWKITHVGLDQLDATEEAQQ